MHVNLLRLVHALLSGVTGLTAARASKPDAPVAPDRVILNLIDLLDDSPVPSTVPRVGEPTMHALRIQGNSTVASEQ